MTLFAEQVTVLVWSNGIRHAFPNADGWVVDNDTGGLPGLLKIRAEGQYVAYFAPGKWETIGIATELEVIGEKGG